MAMERFRAVTEWVAAIPGDDQSSNHPKLVDDYQLDGWRDVTGQDATTQLVPDPNEYTIEAIADETVVDQIITDGVTVQWVEPVEDPTVVLARDLQPTARRRPGKDKGSKPSKNNKKAERQKLEGKGVPPGLAKQLTGEDEDLTSEQIDKRRIAWQQTLPKAS